MTRPLLETLHHLNGGTFLGEAADKLAEVVNSVSLTGKPGSITIKIDLRQATAGALALKGRISAKMPPETPVEALMFPTPEGNLLTEDPRQGKLPLAPVATPSLPVAGAVQSKTA